MKPGMKCICLSLLSSLTLTAGYQVTAQTKLSGARDLRPIPSSLNARAEASLSVTRGILKVEGLKDPVDVLRDRWGVAHIYARNQHDLFFAQGYVAAQDRLFQMELWKRAGQGRLAEIMGPGALQRDMNARLLSYRGDMKSEFESYSPDTREILEAFTDGINAYIASAELPAAVDFRSSFKLRAFNLSRGSRQTV